METLLANVDLFLAWLGSHPALSAVLGAILLGVADRIVKHTPWQGDDCLLDVIEQALKRGRS